MKQYFFYSLVLLVLACKGKKDQVAVTELLSGDPKPQIDTGMLIDPPAPGPSTGQREGEGIYVQRASFTSKNPTITVFSYFVVPGSLVQNGTPSHRYYQDIIVVLRDTALKVADTIFMKMDDDVSYDDELVIEDMTEILEFKTLLLKFSYKGDSDMWMTALVEVKDKKPKLLFDISYLKTIWRENADTLVGVVRHEDEIVRGVQDYPIIYCLKTDTLIYVRPPVQYIGVPTRALENITGRRPDGKSGFMKHTIKKGEELTVDTLYRELKKVRITVKDSIAVYFTPDELSGKIYVSDAG